jgi:hypothetical protein
MVKHTDHSGILGHYMVYVLVLFSLMINEVDPAADNLKYVPINQLFLRISWNGKWHALASKCDWRSNCVL